jgi:hypothetical protein
MVNSMMRFQGSGVSTSWHGQVVFIARNFLYAHPFARFASRIPYFPKLEGRALRARKRRRMTPPSTFEAMGPLKPDT